MAITLYANGQDVRDAYEGTIPVDTATVTRLNALIRRASAKLARLVPSLDRRMAAGEVDPQVPADMVVEAVLRVWRNPAGATQQGVGPFQLSFNQRAAQNEIIFDPTEIEALLGEFPVGQFRVGSGGHQVPLEPLIDAERVQNIVIHPSGL